MASGNRTEIAEPAADEGFTRRRQSSVGSRQRWLAIGLWLVMAAAGLALSRALLLEGIESLLFLVALHGISVLLSVRLPGGVYAGLISTSIVAAGLALGYQHAMLIAPLTGLVAAPAALALTLALPRLRRYQQSLFYEALWHSAAASAALLPAGWLYEQLGGGPLAGRLTLDVAWPVMLFAAVYFTFSTAFQLIWVALSGGRAAAYWRSTWATLIISGLFLPLVIAPFIAVRYHVPDLARLLSLLPYALIAFVVRSVLRARLDLNERIADLRTLNSIGQALNANLRLDDLFTAIHAEIGKLLDTSGFYLALHDEQNGLVDFVLAYQDGEPVPIGARPFANGLSEHIIRTGRPLLFSHDVARRARELGLDPVGCVARSYLGVPVVAGERPTGVIALRDYAREFAYDENDQRVLETIASSAGIALQNARLFERSQRQAGELASLNQVSLLVSAGLDLDTVLERICQIVADVMGCHKSAIFLVDPDSELYYLAGSVGLSQAYRDHSQAIPAKDNARALVLRTREAAVYEDALRHERLASIRDLLLAEGVGAIMDVPLHIGDKAIGSLTVYYERPRRFQPGEIELMNTLAAQASVAVENARLFESMNARHRELEALYQTARAVSASLSPASVLHAVATRMIEVLEVETCVTLLAVEDGKALHAELWMEREGSAIVERPNGATFRLDDLPAIAPAIREQEAIALRRDELEAAGTACRLIAYYGLETALALPLIVHGELLGLIAVGHRSRPAEFELQALRLARALADQAGVAIQNARLFENTDAALAHRRDELAALETILQRMTRRLDLQAVIEQVVAAAALATGAEVSELLLCDEGGQMMRIAARQGIRVETAVDEWPASEGMTGHALRTGEVQLAGDVHANPHYMPTRSNIQSELAVPIMLDERRLGVLNLESTRPDAFDKEQARFISNLAEQAAIAIQNAQLFETVQKRAEEFQTLRAVAIDLLSASDLAHTLKVIARETLQHTGAHGVHIYLYDQASEQLTFGTSLWADSDPERPSPEPRPDGMTATAARSGERLVITNPRKHPLVQPMVGRPDWEQLEALASIPLKHGGEVIGVFNVVFDEPQQQFNGEMLHFLDLLAAEAAVAIQTARLTEQTRLGRDRLEAILNSIHEGIMMFDMQGRLVLANPRAEYLLNQRVADYKGQHFVRVMRHLEIGFGGSGGYSVREAIRLARDVVRNPNLMTRRTLTFNLPTPRVIEETSIAVVGDDQPIGRLFILRDITHEHEVEVFRQEMSHMLVHDLRSPLGGVITGLAMALDETRKVADDEQREMLESTVQIALSSANTLLRLVEEILAINRLEAGEMPLMCEPLNLRQLAERAREVLRSASDKAKIVVSVEAPDDLPPVSGDADKIGRVLSNLLDNALRYTPEGGTVTIRIVPSEMFQTVSVLDTGEGIPAPLRERVFDRFFQGDISRRKRGTKGSGLGLTFCRLAVEAHGGRIWVEDGPGGGAAFHFALPTMAPAPEKDQPES